MQKLNKIFSNQEALIGVFSYPIYICWIIILKFILSACFGLESKILIIARYCKLGLPSGLNTSEITVAFILLAIRFVILLFAILFLKRLNGNKLKTIIANTLLCFGFIDFIAFLTYLYDISFETITLKYFASTLYIFTIAEFCGDFNTMLLLIILLLFTCSFFILKRISYEVSFKKEFIYSILSILLVVSLHFIYKVFIR